MATEKRALQGYLPNDRPPVGKLALLGLQHVLTMFPATVLVAALTGFHIGTVLFASGISTIVALILSRWKIGTFIPLFYGSSFSYIAAYLGISVLMTGSTPGFGQPLPNEVISTMQAGIVVTGVLNIFRNVTHKPIERFFNPLMVFRNMAHPLREIRSPSTCW